MQCSVPGVSGLWATEVLKEGPELRGIPIVLLASSRDAEEEQRAYEAQCDVYVVDPDRSDAVLEALQWLMESEHRRAECRGELASGFRDSRGAPAEIQWVDERMRRTWGGPRRA